MKENNLFRDVVVVADDFTGANDAGVSLTLSGKKVSVAFHTPLPSRWMHWLLIPIPVRCGQQSGRKSGRTGGGYCGCALAHQKIDSTLRGV